MGDAYHVLAKIGAAIVLKLLCGSDDVVWLSPFVARESRWGKCVVAQKYLIVVGLLCSLAVGLAAIVNVASHASSNPSEARVTDKVVSCFAGALLLVYAAHLAREDGWIAWAAQVVASEDGMTADEKAAVTSPLVAPPSRGEPWPTRTEPSPSSSSPAKYGATTDLDEDDDEEYEEDLNCCEDAVRLCLESGLALDEDPEADAARKRFVIVATLGNLDDLLVYFTIALTCTLQWYELVIGTIVGAALIVTAVATCLQSSKRASECVMKIPVSIILVFLASYIIVSAFYPKISPEATDKHA